MQGDGESKVSTEKFILLSLITSSAAKSLVDILACETKDAILLPCSSSKNRPQYPPPPTYFLHFLFQSLGLLSIPKRCARRRPWDLDQREPRKPCYPPTPKISWSAAPLGKSELHHPQQMPWYSPRQFGVKMLILLRTSRNVKGKHQTRFRG